MEVDLLRRVFFTPMGHREDVWTNDNFVRRVTGAMNGVTGRAEADVAPNRDKVTPGAELPREDAAGK
jgi:hypothetical protein